MEVVKKQLLVAMTALSVPLDTIPSVKRIGEACGAAKLLRNRLLREHTRVQDFIESMRQKQLYDQNSEEDDDGEDTLDFDDVASNKSARTEFIFLAEMMVVEKLVVPLLLAHGMKFSDTLLPQLLKLLTAMMQPVPRFSANETLQQDLLKRVKTRCGTDEFFALLVQSVAPVAEKRAMGSLQREDVVLLEVVLTLLTHLLEGNPHDAENVVGSFCRNHGIELLLVIISQNFAKAQQQQQIAYEEEPRGVGENPTKETATTAEQAEELVLLDDSTNCTPVEAPLLDTTTGTAVEEIALDSSRSHSDDEQDDVQPMEDSNDGSEDDMELHIQDAAAEIEKQFEEKVNNLLESDAQIWKWNCLAMKSISSVFTCIMPAELAQLGFLGQTNLSSSDQLLNLLRSGDSFRDCKREKDNWRYIARSRNGAMHSSSVLVRLDPSNRPGTVGGQAIGTVSSLLGMRRKDPLENVKVIDMRKRGRFVRGMFQDSTSRCSLPLPTKILLSQQGQSFLCFGFEPLNTMTWRRIQASLQSVEHASKEYKEIVAGFRNSGERMEITSPLTAEMYRDFENVLNYMVICASLLHYIREVARLMKQDGVPFTSPTFQQQWQSVSCVISLDHLEGGFTVLRSFLQCRDLRRRCSVLCVVNYLAELLFMLNLILEKEVVQDPAVDVAAHALASSVLYKEENIKTVFDLLGEYANRNLSVSRSQSLTLFTFAVFQLMERCSYNGSLLLPKRPKRKSTMHEAGDEGHLDDDDNESVNSATLEAMEKDMVDQMADMIDDDDDSSSSSSSSDGEGEKGDVDENGADGARAKDKQTSADGGHAGSHAGPPLQRMRSSSQGGDAGNGPHDACEDGGAAQASQPEAQEGEGGATGEAPSSRAASPIRASSEAQPPSIASMATSGRTALSTISSEREVAVSSYLRRLATPKNVGLLYSALRHWRINDADVNLGITYLMEGLAKDGCECVFFNVAFLLLFRDVLLHGQRTHGPLYAVCDRLVYSFFNPSFAHTLDFRKKSLFDENDENVLTGSQSFLGFEVGLRCGRSLFSFAAGDYSVLEERAMPHMMEHTEIALPDPLASPPTPPQERVADADAFASSGLTRRHLEGDDEVLEVTEDMVRDERGEPRRKKRRHHDRSSPKEESRRKRHSERSEKHRKKARGPQPPAAEPTLTDAAAAEEERLFQELMAAITPGAAASHPIAKSPSAEDQEEAAILL